MPVSERPPTGNDRTTRVVANRLELPHPVNQLQVAHMITLVKQDTINVVIQTIESQFTQDISPFSSQHASALKAMLKFIWGTTHCATRRSSSWSLHWALATKWCSD